LDGRSIDFSRCQEQPGDGMVGADLAADKGVTAGAVPVFAGRRTAAELTVRAGRSAARAGRSAARAGRSAVLLTDDVPAAGPADCSVSAEAAPASEMATALPTPRAAASTPTRPTWSVVAARDSKLMIRCCATRADFGAFSWAARP
jgi:hypothetical protein